MKTLLIAPMIFYHLPGYLRTGFIILLILILCHWKIIKFLEHPVYFCRFYPLQHVIVFFPLDTGMGLFILYTTCAMILSWLPGVKSVRYRYICSLIVTNIQFRIRFGLVNSMNTFIMVDYSCCVRGKGF